MRAYWLGVLTTPAVLLAVFGLFVAWLRVANAFVRRGITFQAKWRRGTDRISEYTLRHDIWWERSFIAVFTGGWYREQPIYGASSRARLNRWIGVGRPNGPCLMAFHSRDLGEIR